MDEQNTIETPETNYIEIINNMKQTTVSKDEYNRVLADNRKLAESLATSPARSTEEPETPVATDEDIDLMRRNLMTINKHQTNLEFTRQLLDLRDALIARGEPDPFLSNNSQIAPTEADEAKAQMIANGLRQMCDYCGKDAQLFNSELKRCCK